jgi:hypothetical protein
VKQINLEKKRYFNLSKISRFKFFSKKMIELHEGGVLRSMKQKINASIVIHVM